MGSFCSAQEPVQQPHFFLLSSAESDFNKIQKEMKTLTGQAFEGVDVRFDDKLFDSELCEEGRNLAEKAAQQLKVRDVQYVFVSPLKRALQTAEIMFNNHKNNPKIIVLPELREVLGSSSDLNSKIFESCREFSQMDFTYVKTYGNVLNTYLQEINDKNLVDSIVKNVEIKYGKNIGDQTVYANEINSVMKNMYPNSIETHSDVKKRVEQFKSRIKQQAQDKKIHGNVYIVSHQRFFEFFTAKEFIGDHPKDYISLNYCQIIPWEDFY